MLNVARLQAGNLPPLTFQVDNGACLAIEGPSGSGKTRLLRAIADLDPASGQVFFDGAERSEMSPRAWRRVVRYCAAEPGWWTQTPLEAFAAADVSKVIRLLERVGLNETHLKRQVALLSTGERQRLALVRALVDDPRVLLLDEPTAALDPASAALVEELMRYQLISGRSLLLASHDQGLLNRLSDARLQLGPVTMGQKVPA